MKKGIGQTQAVLTLPLDANLKNLLYLEAVAQRCSVKKVFKTFRKIHRKTPVPEPLFY